MRYGGRGAAPNKGAIEAYGFSTRVWGRVEVAKNTQVARRGSSAEKIKTEKRETFRNIWS